MTLVLWIGFPHDPCFDDWHIIGRSIVVILIVWFLFSGESLYLGILATCLGMGGLTFGGCIEVDTNA